MLHSWECRGNTIDCKTVQKGAGFYVTKMNIGNIARIICCIKLNQRDAKYIIQLYRDAEVGQLSKAKTSRMIDALGRFKGKSRLMLLVLYFLLTSVLVILLISVPLYVYTIGVLERERSASNDLLLQQVSGDMDFILSQTDSEATKILFNQGVNDIAFKVQHGLYTNVYDKVKDIQDIQSLLNSEMMYHPFINSIYVYLSAEGRVITGTFYSPLGDFYDKAMISSLDATAQSGWLKARDLNQSTLGTGYTAGPARVLTYYHRTGSGYGSNPAVVIVNVNTQAFSNAPEAMGLQFYLAAGNGDILISHNGIPSGNLISAGLDEGQFTGQTKYWVQSLLQTKYLISSSSSTVNDWRYFIFLPYSDVIQPLLRFREIITLVLSLCLALSLLLAFLFGQNYYKPIQRLANQVAEWAGPKYAGGDDFANLGSAFTALVNENKTFGSVMQDNRKTIMEKYILDILTNPTRADQPFEVDFVYPGFFVMCLKVENPASEELQATARLLELSAIEMICNDVCKAMGGELFASRLDDISLALVINTDDTVNALQYANAFRDAVSAKMSLVCTIGVSRMNGPHQLPQAFSEAKRALSYSILYSAGSIVRADDAAAAEFSDNEEAISVLEDQLMAAVGHREIESAIIIAEKIGVLMSSSSPEQFYRMKYIVLHICQKLAELVSPIPELHQQSDVNLFRQYRETERAAHLQELIAVLKDAMKATIRQLDERATQIDAGMLNRVIDYINAHYMENFGLTQLADRVGIHPAYLGRLLKNFSGKSFNQILTEIRVKYAKEFIKDSSLNINDIYIKIGYTNRQSFIRSFKAQTGMTPTEYRNSLAVERLSK